MPKNSSVNYTTGSERVRGIGGGYLIKLTILISLLMLGNSYVIGMMVKANVSKLPDLFDDVRVYQFFQIFVPMIMVGIQFWIYDRIKDSRIQRRENAN